MVSYNFLLFFPFSVHRSRKSNSSSLSIAFTLLTIHSSFILRTYLSGSITSFSTYLHSYFLIFNLWSLLHFKMCFFLCFSFWVIPKKQYLLKYITHTKHGAQYSHSSYSSWRPSSYNLLSLGVRISLSICLSHLLHLICSIPPIYWSIYHSWRELINAPYHTESYNTVHYKHIKSR